MLSTLTIKYTLLHDNDITALFIKDLVVLLRERGCKIITPTEAYSDPLLTTAPDVVENNQGRVMAIAKSKGYSGPYRQGENALTIEQHFTDHHI